MRCASILELTQSKHLWFADFYVAAARLSAARSVDTPDRASFSRERCDRWRAATPTNRSDSSSATGDVQREYNKSTIGQSTDGGILMTGKMQHGQRRENDAAVQRDNLAQSAIQPPTSPLAPPRILLKPGYALPRPYPTRPGPPPLIPPRPASASGATAPSSSRPRPSACPPACRARGRPRAR